ncbi:MAG: alpha/beta hydrolase [Deltaproteobacteria bacterium]|nr:MAG: alpha/beta hydrolase [Deltaproteobacteria bacterium]
MHMLVKIVSAVLFLYLVYCGLLFLLQRQILFPRHQIEVPRETDKNIPGLDKIWLDTNYGKVEAWFLPPAPNHSKGLAPAVIFAHGNAELIDFWPEELKKFTSLGIGVLLVEYPGYGRSEGRPSQRSIAEAFVTAYDALIARKEIDPTRIVLFGRSLGGGAVCALAAERPSAALILLSTFTSVQALASNFLVPGFLVRDPFDNLTVVRSYPGPILVIHGRHDSLVPHEHGADLYRAAQRGKMLTYDCRHNDCPPSWDTFWRDVESFLLDAGIIKNSD